MYSYWCSTLCIRLLSRPNDRIVRRKDHRSHLHRPRLQAKRGVGIARLQLQLQQHPDIVGQLQRLVQHVLALDVPFSDRKDIVARHLGGQAVRSAHQTREIVLQLVSGWNLLPRAQKHTLVQLSVVGEEDVAMDQTRKVEDVHVVLNRHLQIVQRLHSLHSASCAQSQRHLKERIGSLVNSLKPTFYSPTHLHRLRWLEHGHLQWPRRPQAETVLVQLDREPSHRLHGLVRKRHLHGHGAGPLRERALHLQALALLRGQPHDLGHLQDGRRWRTQAEDVA